MSSPIDIPRASSSSARSSSGSPTGLYVPIHKRVSSSSSPATRPEVLPLRSSNASPSSRRAKRASVTPVLTASQRSDSHIPMLNKIPHIYSTPELLALSASPFVRLTSAQRSRVEQLLPTMFCEPVAAPSLAPAEKRRRRTGRKTAPSKKLSVKVTEDVESRRKRHGGWGWQLHAMPSGGEGAERHEQHVGLEEGWRSARALEVHA